MTRPLSAKPSVEAKRGPLISVVVVNYNGWPDVSRLVASVAAASDAATGSCDLVVVDNASQDPPPFELTALHPRLRLIAMRENGGFAAGVNAGWRHSDSPWLLVLNPDVVVPEGQLAEILARAAQFAAAPDQAPGIVGFALRNADGTPQPSVGAFPNLARTIWEQLIPRSRRKYQPAWRLRAGSVDWVTGACMLVNTRMLEAVGGMDEDFFLYYEEVDLCHAATQGGWRVEFDPSVHVVHLHPLQNRAISPKMRVITRHSKLLYFRKHLPRWQFLSLAAIVAAEAAVRATCSRFQGRIEEERAWRTISGVVRAFRAGVEPRGRDVLMLADTVGSPDSEAEGPGPAGASFVSDRTRRGATGASLMQRRKDGPTCR